MCGCGGCCGGPPYGIPIEDETHEQYSPELKAAWAKFDEWFKKAQEFTPCDEPIIRETMPKDIKMAMDLILKTPIPGYPGYTGADSCYMSGVEMQISEPLKINKWAWLVCHLSFKTIHLRTKVGVDGIYCVDCGYFKDKASHMADMHAGGGW